MTAAGASPSDTPEYRTFDFWLGRWEVRTADGKLAGFNEITQEYAGHVLRERYTSISGYRGESLNIYDPARAIWHQTWVDTSGTLLLLEGGVRDGNMVLESSSAGANTRNPKHRITWTPNADGSVRQHWESRDDEREWKTVFDGLYTKVRTNP